MYSRRGESFRLARAVRWSLPAVLFALSRDDFLGAVTGHEEGHAAAETVVAERLALSTR